MWHFRKTDDWILHDMAAFQGINWNRNYIHNSKKTLDQGTTSMCYPFTNIPSYFDANKIHMLGAYLWFALRWFWWFSTNHGFALNKRTYVATWWFEKKCYPGAPVHVVPNLPPVVNGRTLFKAYTQWKKKITKRSKSNSDLCVWKDSYILIGEYQIRFWSAFYLLSEQDV